MTTASQAHSTDLIVQGMTCASCVRRVERALLAVPGVQAATVNLATHQARVTYDPQGTTPDRLADAIVAAGYESPKPQRAAASARADALADAEAREQRAIRRDFLIALVLSVPPIIVAMSHGTLPGLAGELGRLLQFLLLTPVVFGPGRRFLRLAWKALRHHTADMNTLVSIGVLAAWGYSTVALFAPQLFPHAAHGALPHLYFEAAAAIITFVLLGKILETRRRQRLPDPGRGLVAPPARDRARSSPVLRGLPSRPS